MTSHGYYPPFSMAFFAPPFQVVRLIWIDVKVLSSYPFFEYLLHDNLFSYLCICRTFTIRNLYKQYWLLLNTTVYFCWFVTLLWSLQLPDRTISTFNLVLQLTDLVEPLFVDQTAIAGIARILSKWWACLYCLVTCSLDQKFKTLKVKQCS